MFSQMVDQELNQCLSILSQEKYEKTIQILDKRIKIAQFLKEAFDTDSDIRVGSLFMLDEGFTREEQEEVRAFIIKKIRKKDIKLKHEFEILQSEREIKICDKSQKKKKNQKKQKQK